MKRILIAICVLVITAVTANAQEIFDAVRSGNLAKVKELVEKDPQLVKARTAQLTPLHVAAEIDNEEISKYLIEKGADIAAKDENSYTPLMHAGIKVTKFLVEKGADVNYRTPYSGSVLENAIWAGGKEKVDYLLDKGAEKPPTGPYYLLWGLKIGSIKYLEKCLQSGLDPLFESNGKSSLLHYAAAGNSLELVNKLMDLGVPLKKTNIFGWTPLHTAAYNGNLEMAKFLIKKGLDKNARSVDGRSPYNLASEADKQEMADYLISIGADQSPQKFPELRGDYLGQPKPGKKAIPFASGIVSGQYYFHGSFTFTPDGNEAYWSVMGVNNLRITIMRSKKTNGIWTKPEPMNIIADVPFISPDGNKFYFVSWEEGIGQQQFKHNIKVMNKADGGWSGSYALPEIINSVPGIYWGMSVDKKGNLYFGAQPNGAIGEKIYYSEFNNGFYSKPAIMENMKNIDAYSPYIAQDGSYLIYTKMIGEFKLNIIFRQNNGTWTKEYSLKEIIGYDGICPIVSQDGKYFFFLGQLDGKYSQYWVDTSFIEDLRKEALKDDK